MRLFLVALACVALLAGCATAPRDLYAPYKQNFGTYVANSEVDTFCLAPKLRFAIAASKILGWFLDAAVSTRHTQNGDALTCRFGGC